MLRSLFAVLVLAVTLAADAPAQARITRIGVITGGSAAQSAPFLDVFRVRLRELGHVEGRNIAIEVRYPGDHPGAYRDAAVELVALNVDIVVTANTGATRAAHEQTRTIPIVMVSVGNAVGAGFAKTLSRPGSNITGQSFLGAEIQLKGIDLLIEALPRARRIAMLYDPQLVTSDRPDWQPIIDAARAKGVTVVPVRMRSSDDLATVLSSMGGPQPDALHVFAVNVVEQLRLAEAGARQGIPVICNSRDAINTGALMTYGPNFVEFWRGAATYVDKILKGAKPADLPVEQPTTFQLAVNLKTAKALGITLPRSLLVRADQIVQ